MTLSLADLPEDILHIICEYLDVPSLKSASQAHRSLSQVYQRHCYRILTLDIYSEHLWEKFELIERWDSKDRLKHVQHVFINDSGERSRDGRALLQLVLSQTLPKMTGLRRVKWNFSGRFAPLEQDFRFPKLPARVRLEMEAAQSTAAEPSVPVMTQILSGLQHHVNLHFLDVAFDAAAPQLHELFKTTLLTCNQLRIVKVRAQNGGSLIPNAGRYDPNYSGHRWTPEDVVNFPALEELEFDYDVIEDGVLEDWAIYGNWKSLHTLTLRNPRMLQYLAGKTPVLQTLRVGALSWLEMFLEQSTNVSSLVITGMHSNRGAANASANFRALLALPVAANLRTLELRLLQEQHMYQTLHNESIHVKTVAAACPQLRQLVVSIEPDQYRGTDGMLHWQQDCAQVVANLPYLRRFALILPHVISQEETSGTSEFVTFSTAENLWKIVCCEGRRLEHMSVIASLGHEGTLYAPRIEARPFANTRSLTFAVVPAEKDWDASNGEYSIDCLELARAEASLARGDLRDICDTGRYVDARKWVDDLASLADRGYVVAKKPPRAMPDHLTAAVEEDSRSAPTRRQRAKRRINSAIDIFFDNFKPYNVETNTQSSPQEMSSSLDPPAARRHLTQSFIKRWSR